MPSVSPQPGGERGSEKEVAAKVAASFASPEKPQVTQPEATAAQPDHRVEAASADEGFAAVNDKISELPGQVAQAVSAPVRQVGEQVVTFSHPDRVEESLNKLQTSAKGPADLQLGVSELRLAHIEAHHDLEREEAPQ